MLNIIDIDISNILFSGYSNYSELPADLSNGTTLDRDAYYWNFSDYKPLECLWSGVVSLGLTILNILCIIVTGVLILKLKEVTPEKIPQQFSNFWRKDVRVHRDYYKAVRKGDEKRLPAWSSCNNVKEDENVNANMLETMWMRAEHDEDLQNIRHWVTLASGCKEPGSARVVRDDENPFAFYPLPAGSATREEEQLLHPQVRHRSRSTSRTVFNRNTVNLTNYYDVREFWEREIMKSRQFRERLNKTADK